MTSFSSQTQSRVMVCLFAVICLLCFFIYLPAVNGPMLFDDKSNILFNDGIKINELNSASLLQAASSMQDTFTSRHPYLNRPISYISFALNYYFADDFFRSLKVTNTLLHVMCGFLIYALVTQLVTLASQNTSRYGNDSLPPCAQWLPLFVTSFWLLHPLMVSTVLYSVQRMTILSAFFSLAGIVSFIHLRQKLLLQANNTLLVIGAGLLGLFTALAFLCKENGILTPLLCAVIEVCFFRFRFSQPTTPAFNTMYKTLLISPVVLVVSYLVKIYIFSNADTTLATREFDTNARLLTESRITLEYLYWLVVPDIRQLTFLHDTVLISKDLLSPITTIMAVLTWMGTFAGLAWLLIRNRLPWLSFGVLWFIVGHLLESTVITLELVFEHRNYLPYVGPVFSLAWAITLCAQKFKASAVISLSLLSTLFIAMPAAATMERVKHWRSEEALIIHLFDINSGSPRVWAKAADLYFSHGDVANTMKALDQAFSYAPWEAGYGLAQIGVMCTFPDNFGVKEVIAMRDKTLKALKQVPTTSYSISQYSNMIHMCSDLQQVNAFAAIHEAAARINNTILRSRSNYMLALIALEKKEVASAQRFLEIAYEADPKSSEVLSLKASVDLLLQQSAQPKN